MKVNGRKPGKNAGREFTAEVYLAAANEHASRLESLYYDEYYVWALYAAGVAVEAMFRAYRCRIDPEFDSRHNLAELAKTAKFGDAVPSQQIEEYAVALSALVPRWNNNQRYRSDVALRMYLKRAKLDRGVRGDYLKQNTRLAVTAAVKIVTIGEQQWKNSSND